MSLEGHLYTFVIIVNPRKARNEEPFLFFISDLKDAQAIANHYLKRWKIECCFKHLKKNGFNIEDINLKADNKIELMMGIVTITYMVVINEGIIQESINPTKMKIYKNGMKYPLMSIFRKGYLELQKSFSCIALVLKYVNLLLKPCLTMDSLDYNSKSV
jgi:hypothetical protein